MMNLEILRKVFSLIAVMLLVGGCKSVPAPQEKFYRLDPIIGESVSAKKGCGTILVGRLGSRGFAGGRAIVFRNKVDPLQVQRYNYHLWSEPPASMIQDGVAQSLRASGIAEYVITPAERASTEWIVSGVLVRMDHFPESEPPYVELELEIGVVSTANRQTVFFKTYRETEAAVSNSIVDAVKAFNSVFQRILTSIQEDVTVVLDRERALCAL